jgi:uncharacterized protein (DUF427 family)
MATIRFHGFTIAECERAETMSGRTFVPPEAIVKEHFLPSPVQTCDPVGMKGVANYYTIKCGDKILQDACLYYPHAAGAAVQIKNWVGFRAGNGVSITRK